MPAMIASPRPRSSASSSCSQGSAWIWHFSAIAEFGADGAREIDVEAGQPAVAVEKVEGRKIGRRQEAQARQRAEVRLGQALLAVPEHRRVRLLGCRCGACKKRRRGECQDSRSKLHSIPTVPTASTCPGVPDRPGLGPRISAFPMKCAGSQRIFDQLAFVAANRVAGRAVSLAQRILPQGNQLCYIAIHG